MMRRLFGFLLLALLSAGCSKPIPTSDASSPGSHTDEDVASADNVSAETEYSATETYPEKSEVTRLMYRANIEFEAGRFNEALVIVEKALSVDSHSVTASELRTRITDILIRS